MSLPTTTSTVFSLLTSSLSSSSTSEEEDITTTIDVSSTFTNNKSTTAANTTAFTTTDVTSTSTTTIGNITFSTGESSSSGESDFNNLTTTDASIFGEDFFNENTTATIDITNSSAIINSSLDFNNTNGNNNGSIPSNFTNELEFPGWEDDSSNNSLYTSTDSGEEDFGDVSREPTTYVPLFYFLLTIVLGIYVFLYFLQRHLKAKAARNTEDEQKKRVEERIKRGGCRYDFEDDEESDYGPPEQNLSVAALRFYGGGSRK